MRKSLIALVLIILVAIAVLFWKSSEQAPMSTVTDQRTSSDEIVTGNFPAPDDTTGSINKDADSISVDDFGADLDSLDGDIDSF